MPKITISYRRDDSMDITGRIFDRLASRYGRETVFRDIDNIPPGRDFREHIRASIDTSDVLMVVVGPRWMARFATANRGSAAKSTMSAWRWRPRSTGASRSFRCWWAGP
jgi:hypothetical protein